MRWLLLTLLAVAPKVDLTACDDELAECKETCTVDFGGVTDLKARERLLKCRQRCEGKDAACRERVYADQATAEKVDPARKAAREVPDAGREAPLVVRPFDDEPARPREGRTPIEKVAQADAGVTARVLPVVEEPRRLKEVLPEGGWEAGPDAGKR